MGDDVNMMIVEGEELAEIYEAAGLGLFDGLGAFDVNADVLDDLEIEGWITAEGEGDGPTATLIEWLNFLLSQYHDFGFIPREIDVVKVIHHRAGTRVYGGYLPTKRDVPPLAIRKLSADSLLLRKIGNVWRAEIQLGPVE